MYWFLAFIIVAVLLIIYILYNCKRTESLKGSGCCKYKTSPKNWWLTGYPGPAASGISQATYRDWVSKPDVMRSDYTDAAVTVNSAPSAAAVVEKYSV